MLIFLGWTFYLLARHPEVFEKLREIILSDFGTFESPHSLTFANLKACTYLQHVMNEVLRLYPNVPVNARRALHDTSLPHGGGPDGKSPVFVPAGQDIIYSVHVMQRRKDLWGEDASEFKPERWAGRKGGWEFLPFNGGPRICLGQQFALTEAAYVIARLLQKFERLENADERGGEVREVLSVTSSPDGCVVKMKEATS